jgi:ATP-dependent exoDNAse (exonuclease V) beta subunit
MEYDSIQIVNDFITEEKIEKIKNDFSKEEQLNLSKINEEINMLYVAITRTKNSIYITETFVPDGYEQCAQIHQLKVEEKEKKKEMEIPQPSILKEKGYKTYSVSKVREDNRDAYKPWTEELDDELTLMYCEDVNIKEMAKHFGRTKGAILSRIRKLELEELYG